jgi:hypothetical protein
MTEADHPDFSDSLEWRRWLHKAGFIEKEAKAYADILVRDPAQPEAAC